jgi:aminopeptidase N
MLREMNDTFYHSTVTTAQIENFISRHAEKDLSAFFNQYLRTKDIPEVEYYIKDGLLHYHFNKVVQGFLLPLQATDGKKKKRLEVTADWQETKWKGGYNLSFSKDFLITVKS